MDEHIYKLLIDLHKGNQRQGPGSNHHTRKAIDLSGLSKSESLNIADIGCGTGASACILAEDLNVTITAVDLFPDFLEVLEKNAGAKGLGAKIKTLACAMDVLPFEKNSLDAIWSEGAIYNMGFEKGICYFKQFLKPGGVLAVSELTWLTENRPSDLTAHWKQEYAEVATASTKIKILEQNGFMLMGYFPLPECCWLDNYYTPLESRFTDFLNQNSGEDAQSIIDAEIREINLYKEYKDYYSYGFYIAKRKQ